MNNCPLCGKMCSKYCCDNCKATILDPILITIEELKKTNPGFSIMDAFDNGLIKKPLGVKISKSELIKLVKESYEISSLNIPSNESSSFRRR